MGVSLGLVDPLLLEVREGGGSVDLGKGWGVVGTYVWPRERWTHGVGRSDLRPPLYQSWSTLVEDPTFAPPRSPPPLSTPPWTSSRSEDEGGGEGGVEATGSGGGGRVVEPVYSYPNGTVATKWCAFDR